MGILEMLTSWEFYVGVGTLVATFLVVRYVRESNINAARFREEDKKLAHSAHLNGTILEPWRKTIIRRHDDRWSMTIIPHRDDRTAFLDPPHADLRDLPDYPLATAHVKDAYPKIWTAWSTAVSMIEEANRLVPDVRDALRDRLPTALRDEFGTAIEPLDGYEPNRWNVCYVEPTVGIIWGAIANAEEVELTPTPIPDRAQPEGYGISREGTEIARVRDANDAVTVRWDNVLASVIESKEVRRQVRAVEGRIAEAEKHLEVFKGNLKDLITGIRNGDPIEGKCRLGY
jgi:hypothetical protein